MELRAKHLLVMLFCNHNPSFNNWIKHQARNNHLFIIIITFWVVTEVLFQYDSHKLSQTHPFEISTKYQKMTVPPQQPNKSFQIQHSCYNPSPIYLFLKNCGKSKMEQNIVDFEMIKEQIKSKDYYRNYNQQMNKAVILILLIGLTISCNDASCPNGAGTVPTVPPVIISTPPPTPPIIPPTTTTTTTTSSSAGCTCQGDSSSSDPNTPLVQPVIPNPTPLPPPTTPSLPECSCQKDDPNVPVSTLPVNSQITISTPTTIAPPPCAIETITPPTISAPVISTPIITVPTINVPTVNVPNVVAPPTVTPPTPLIPVIQTPVIIAPPTPPPITPTKPIIPIPPVLILPPAPPTVCTSTQSSSFTLSFQYACRQSISFLSCMGQVVWNNNIIYSITPADYNIRQVTINITVLKGLNVLQFIGAGISDSYGLSIDNVKLVRVGTTNSIVINGDFSAPNTYGSWSIQNDINGWTGIGIQIGQGTIYNSGWSGQVCELDGNSNYAISQSFNFDTSFNLVVTSSVSACNNPYPGQTLTYSLEFDWAVRNVGFSNLNSSMANIIWNNVVIATLVANTSNSGINRAVYSVVLNPGNNILQIDGTSLSDSYGVSITNVVLYSKYNNTNLIVNGKFLQTPIQVYTYNYVNGGLPGWTAFKAEVGDCRIYNSLWAVGLCIELDSDSNQRYTQVVTISQQQYSSLILYMSSVVGNGQVISNTNLAVNQANNQVSTSISTINQKITQSISMTVSKFNSYLNTLYQCSGAAVRNIQANEYLTISQYSSSSSDWIKYFGQSGELDFSCSGYSQSYLTNSYCTIQSICGKVIQCTDNSGSNYHLQVSPCSHLEGHHALPQIGTKIFWKGTQGSTGNINVMVATSCNC